MREPVSKWGGGGIVSKAHSAESEEKKVREWWSWEREIQKKAEAIKQIHSERKWWKRRLGREKI